MGPPARRCVERILSQRHTEPTWNTHIPTMAGRMIYGRLESGSSIETADVHCENLHGFTKLRLA
jgi:hypothetical protein